MELLSFRARDAAVRLNGVSEPDREEDATSCLKRVCNRSRCIGTGLTIFGVVVVTGILCWMYIPPQLSMEVLSVSESPVEKTTVVPLRTTSTDYVEDFGKEYSEYSLEFLTAHTFGNYRIFTSDHVRICILVVGFDQIEKKIVPVVGISTSVVVESVGHMDLVDNICKYKQFYLMS